MKPSSLIWVEDIEYFEGPLLSLYRTDSYQWFLEKWCSVGVTLLTPATLEDLDRYKGGEIDMLTLLGDTGWVNGEPVTIKDLPNNFLPQPGAMFLDDLL